jgi:hypothetical protein
MDSASSFNELLPLHRELDELFALHQESLLAMELRLGRELLAAYRELIGLHMGHEEDELLSLFARAGHVEKWPAVLYTGQHEKMRGMLEQVDDALGSLIDQPSARPRRGIIALLDRETTYKHLGEHHDGAEREGLFPICDSVSEPGERTALVTRLVADWRNARRGFEPLIQRAHTLLG